LISKLNELARLQTNSRAVAREIVGNVWPGGKEQQILCITAVMCSYVSSNCLAELRVHGAAP